MNYIIVYNTASVHLSMNCSSTMLQKYGYDGLWFDCIRQFIDKKVSLIAPTFDCIKRKDVKICKPLNDNVGILSGWGRLYKKRNCVIAH